MYLLIVYFYYTHAAEIIPLYFRQDLVATLCSLRTLDRIFDKTVSLVLATITGANYMQEQRQPKQQLAIITRTRKGCKYNSESR